MLIVLPGALGERTQHLERAENGVRQREGTQEVLAMLLFMIVPIYYLVT